MKKIMPNGEIQVLERSSEKSVLFEPATMLAPVEQTIASIIEDINGTTVTKTDGGLIIRPGPGCIIVVIRE